jgi:hypothetical protein
MATTSNTVSSTSNNITTGASSTNTGILSNAITNNGTNPYTHGIASPYFTTTGILNTATSAMTITDSHMTYDSKFSDGLTYQHEVAVIQVTRNDDGEITKSKMVKVFWVETKTQGSIDYAASKDPAVNEFEPNDIIIKTLRTIRL